MRTSIQTIAASISSNRTCRVLLCTLLCVAPIALCPVSQAQTANTGAIAGTVTDPSGAVVAGAQIKVNNDATGEVRTATSSRQGTYLVLQLSPGAYTLQVADKGFKGSTYPNLQVNVTETLGLNVHLVVGDVRENVTVEGAGEDLQVDSSALGRVTSGVVVNSLPLVARNYTQVIGLNPGVAAEVTNAGELGRGGGSDGSDAFVSQGGSSRDNNFQMNGVEIDDFEGSGSFSGGIATPNPDAIQEFKVQTGQYDATYGRDAGANVDVITKGGGNDFHGNVFEYFRNEDLNANDYFRKLNGQPRAVLRQNQFGFTLGGPVKRDKLLLFTSYQGTRQSNGVDPRCSSNYNSPPLTNDRSAAGLGALFAGQPTFASLLGIPGGTTVAANGSNISPQALALLNQKLPNGQFLIPTPQTVNASAPFAVQGFSSFSIPCTFNEDQFIANADFLQSAKSVFYARFFFANSDQNITLPVPKLPGAPTPGFAGPIAQRFRNTSLTHNYIFSSKLLNQAEIGYHRQVSSTGQEVPFTFSSIGSAAPPFADNLPNIGILGSLGLGGGGQRLLLIQNTYVAQDTLSWVRGRHSFRFGGGATRVQNNVESFQFLGGLLFGTFPDFLLGQSAAQNGTPLSNIFLSIDVGGLFPRKFRVWDGTAYAQDDFKVTQHLTLNLGFRYERLGDIGEELGRNANFDPARANPNPPATGSFAGFVVPSNFSGGTVPAGVVSTGNNLGIRGDNQNTFDPRVGFAWQGARNVVLRGGYGIYHSHLTNQPLFNLLTNQPFSSVTQLQAFANGGASFANPFPSTAPFTPGFTPYSPTTQLSPIFIAQGLRPPMLQRYSLNTQTAMGAGLVFELGYVGTRSIHLIRSRSVNQAGLASPSSPIRGQTTNTLANIAQRVPLEGFTAGNLSVLETEGSANYNALEASLTKRFSSGLQFLASYTWSKDLSTDSASTTGPNGGAAVGDQNNPRSRYGPDDFIRPQRFILSGVYALPTLERRAFPIRAALGGWRLSGVTTLQSGQQLAVVQTNPANTFGITNDFAQLAPACSNLRVGTPGGVTSRLNNYINRSCFTGPPVVGPDGSTGFGNTRPGILKGPDQINTDLSLAKLFPLGFLHEKSNIEFRAEAFNVFNHAQFANPTTDFALATFGHIQSTAVAPRVVQFALKLNF